MKASQDECLICQYPSWTDGAGDENIEVICEKFEKLQKSSENGCIGCKLLVKAWEYGSPVPDERGKECITFNRCSGNLYVHLFKHPHGIVNIDVFTIAGTTRFKHIRPASLIPASTSLAENLGMIQKWLRSCEERHDTCNISNGQVPPRLLDLGSDESSDIIRLVEQEQIQQSWTFDNSGDFRYACLSHCWGKTRHKHLTRESNLENNFKGVPICDLPRTFRDAIAVSRALSIRYLWIDSLCIVQDDHADWKMHVSRMAHIYRKAYITLAAGASEDDDGGFFQQAKLPFALPSSFKLHDTKIEYEMYMRKCLPHPDEDWPVGEQLPLMNRGWVFQERLLSRRFLCFAANEVHWECLEDVACSCSTTADGFKYHSQSSKPALLNCPPSKFSFAKLDDLPREELWSLWRQLVKQYTRRELTFPDDKLPALAGLADKFRAAGAGDYVHGLWEDSIEKDMLWYNLGYNISELRPRKGPSWSWISAADGGIEWDGLYKSRASGIRLVDGAFEKQIDELSWGLLCIQGPLMHVCLSQEEIDNGMEVYQGFRACSVREWIAPNNHPNTSPDSVKNTETQGKRGELWADYKFWSNEENMWQILDDIFFLDLGLDAIEFWDCEEDNSHATGLILRPCDRELDGMVVFERIGRLRYSTGQSSTAWEPAGVMTEILIA
jgi:hypothetical protein